MPRRNQARSKKLTADITRTSSRVSASSRCTTSSSTPGEPGTAYNAEPSRKAASLTRVAMAAYTSANVSWRSYSSSKDVASPTRAALGCRVVRTKRVVAPAMASRVSWVTNPTGPGPKPTTVTTGRLTKITERRRCLRADPNARSERQR